MDLEAAIKETAILLLSQEGPAATDVAASRAEAMLADGDEDLAIFWRLVLGEIKKMLAAKPKGTKH